MKKPVFGWLVVVLWLGWGGGAMAEPPWYTTGADGQPVVDLYFFWSQSCPHCQRARPDVEAMAAELPWLRLHSQEVSHSRDNARQFRDLATQVGQQAVSVPSFLFCGTMVSGYDSPAGMGRRLRAQLAQCRADLQAGRGLTQARSATAQQLLHQAGLGGLDLQQRSLLLVTLAIAAMDAFNPCAFFVLLFLLSLLVHAGGRGRMLLVGGVFVAVSGLVYFGLMAAWLNLFLVTGQLPWVSLAAGGLAVVMALFNIKDYLRPGQGPSLSIPEGAKPGLFQRMRALLRAEQLFTLLLGTVGLAVVANSYELLCTAGFPMLYTRLLTLERLPTAVYYLYLAFYNLIYVVPLLAIVVAFTYTLGSRKLQAGEGRLLKLLSGSMMLGLGLALLVAPERLGDLRVAAGILGLAVLITLLAWAAGRIQKPK